MTEKIRPDHLRRTAYVYVRQSSGHQVRHHQESRQRQYALADRARALGFAETVVIDEDQGKSGSGRQERSGFGRLLTAVCQGQAGAGLRLGGVAARAQQPRLVSPDRLVRTGRTR